MALLDKKPKKARKKIAQPEFEHQCALILWTTARYEQAPELWPDLDMIHCSLSGVKLTAAQAGKAKAAGMRKGVLDVILDKPIGGYHGLRIEMKAPATPGKPRGRPTPEQMKEVIRLRALGYRAEFCYGVEEAKAVIRDYYAGGRDVDTSN